MKRYLPLLCALAALAPAASAAAQAAPPGFREEFLGQFESSSRKLQMLAEAMPEESYDWRPGEGVMPVGQVYAHIARYNYYYPLVALDAGRPPGLEVDEIESITDKEQVVSLLRASANHVREVVRAMPEAQLGETTRLYNRDIAQWAVLLQLLAHMNEHLGQSIAYARMNGVVPPWSQ